MAKQTNTLNKTKTTAPTASESEIILRNSRVVRATLSDQLDDIEARAAKLREQIAAVERKKRELDDDINLYDVQIDDLNEKISRAEKAARLTVGSEIEFSTRTRVNELQKQHNQLVLNREETAFDAQVKKLKLDDDIAQLQDELRKLADEEQDVRTAIADLQQQEAEAREQRGREVLTQLENEIEAAEEAHRAAEAAAADTFQTVMELRMGAKNRLREFGLDKDAERLSPVVAAPVSPAERVFRAQYEYLTALVEARDVMLNDVLRLPGTPHQTRQKLIDLLALTPGIISDYLNGRDMHIISKTRAAEQYAGMARERATTPRRNG